MTYHGVCPLILPSVTHKQLNSPQRKKRSKTACNPPLPPSVINFKMFQYIKFNISAPFATLTKYNYTTQKEQLIIINRIFVMSFHNKLTHIIQLMFN